MSKLKPKRQVLAVILDGIGLRSEEFGNAVAVARTPSLDFFQNHCIFTTLKAHGTAVGLPSDQDMGNSEVGHNALGSGRIVDQGAKLVQQAVDSKKIFEGAVWREVTDYVKRQRSTLHLIGMLSDGNVHSHENHLYCLIEGAKQFGIRRVRLHVLLDGRDVGEKSAEIYLDRLQRFLKSIVDDHFDVKVASGGGRMVVTMDRYQADWQIVKRGWDAHVEGQADFYFSSIEEAVAHFRKEAKLTDQYIPAFVIKDHSGKSLGPIENGDGVILFNFRGDRAIEISRAFGEKDLQKFERKRVPEVYFAGMMEYDGDLKIPQKYLISPPVIKNTLGDYLCDIGVLQFACSETQKYGHVTYFWNGNRSGQICEKLEEYLEIPSDKIQFDLKPEMKAKEITDATIEHMLKRSFEFGRINFANGDMVGHTGNFDAAVVAVETVDKMLGRLKTAAEETGMILLVTADHGNSDEMFSGGSEDKFPNWRKPGSQNRPAPKTSHSLSPVPFYLFDPLRKPYNLTSTPVRTLANIANTVLELMRLPQQKHFLPSLVKADEKN